MLSTGHVSLLFLAVLMSHLNLAHSSESPSMSADTASTVKTVNPVNTTTLAASSKARLAQGQEILRDAFAKMDRGTVMRGAIVLAGITCLVLLYVGIKTFL